MESRHTIVRQVASIGGSILLIVLLAACGTPAGAPATSTVKPVATPLTTALATTPPTLATPTPTTAPVTPPATAQPITTIAPPAQPTIPPVSTPISTGQIVFAALQPPPDSVSHRSAAITFTVQAPLPIASIHVSLDGKPVTPEVGGRDQRHLSAFYQPPQWTTGRHTVVATVVAGKQTITHSWSFTID